MNKYLEFKFVKQKPKTKVFHVIAKRTGDCLGVIQWYGAWRQYIFMPRGGGNDETVKRFIATFFSNVLYGRSNYLP